MGLDAAFIKIQLTFTERELVTAQTFRECGLEHGAEVLVVVTPDEPPALVNSSDID